MLMELISLKQINDAKLGKRHSKCECSDFISHKYDSVFINASSSFTQNRIKAIFKKLNLVTKPNGKIYLQNHFW